MLPAGVFTVNVPFSVDVHELVVQSIAFILRGGGEGGGGVLGFDAFGVFGALREMELCSSRLLVSERRTRVAKGTPAAAAAAEEVADHDDDLPDPLDDLPERGEVCFGW